MHSSEKILVAAECCMRDHGFSQTSVQSIASQANVSVGLIYRYYKSKEAIVEALVLRVVQRMKVMLNDDFEKIAHASKEIPSDQDFIPMDMERNIGLLLEVYSEAVRNPRIKKITEDAWNDLRGNFIVREKESGSQSSISSLNTRIYIMSLVIDGFIIRRCMKKMPIPEGFIPFYFSVCHEVNQR